MIRLVILVFFISAMRERIVHSIGKVLKVCCAMYALSAQCVGTEEHLVLRLSLMQCFVHRWITPPASSTA